MPSDAQPVPSAEGRVSRWSIRSARPEDGRQLQVILDESPEAANWIPKLSGVLGGVTERTQTEGAGSTPSTIVVVAADLMEIAGFAAARLIAEEAEILNVAVGQAHRRKGVGSQLLQNLVANLQRQGARRIFLEVRESNRAASGLYQKHGFVRSGLRRGYYRNPHENAVILRRNLAEF